MMEYLAARARDIVESERAAGHSVATVYAALRNVEKTGGVNSAVRLLNDMRPKTVPRWLVDRWAHDADLITKQPHRHR